MSGQKASTKKVVGGSLVRRAEQGKLVYKIDCSIPYKDGLLDDVSMEAFKVYFEEHIKINGKVGQLGDRVKVSVDGATIVITKFQVLFHHLHSARFLFCLLFQISDSDFSFSQESPTQRKGKENPAGTYIRQP